MRNRALRLAKIDTRIYDIRFITGLIWSLICSANVARGRLSHHCGCVYVVVDPRAADGSADWLYILKDFILLINLMLPFDVACECGSI